MYGVANLNQDPRYGPRPGQQVIPLVSHHIDHDDRSTMMPAFVPGSWKEAKDIEHPPLPSSLRQPQRTTYGEVPFQTVKPGYLSPQGNCSNAEQLAQVGKQIYNSLPCDTPVAKPRVSCMPTEVAFKTSFVGSGRIFIPLDPDRCENPNCGPRHRFDELYRSPKDWNEMMYERAIEAGRIWDETKHPEARQKWLQFLTSDFAGGLDPYTVAVAKPNRGTTLAEAKAAVQFPRPAF